MANIEGRAKGLGAVYLVGDVLRSNRPMNALARKAGFHTADVPRDTRLVRIVKDLTLPQAAQPCETPTAYPRPPQLAA